MSRSRMLAVVASAMCAALPVSEAAAERAFGSRPLERPMRGADVRTLQSLLTQWGLATDVDGMFGRHTALRVRSWERNTSRRVDGRMSRRDLRALQASVERGETLPGYPPATDETTPPAPGEPGEKATIGPDGLAIAPSAAPPEVKALIAAGNEIHDLPYKYGGGHGRWNDTGYDCSGSMSYVYHAAGMLETALDSSGFMRWGDAGKGRWVTNYANAGHSYMVIAGLRFDTSGRADDGSRWDTEMRSASGYAARHPSGL